MSSPKTHVVALFAGVGLACAPAPSGPAVPPPAEQLGDGDHTRTLPFAGLERSYLVHVPAGLDRAKPQPVVLAFHGGGTSAPSMVRFSGLSEKADEAGFVVVYPSGTGRLGKIFLTFNAGSCCAYAKDENIDDVGFTRALLDDLSGVIPVDAKRVYATGMSNGGMMAHRLGCELSDRIAAIAPVAGGLEVDTCEPSSPVSVMHFHGTDDEFAPYAGGRGAQAKTNSEFNSVENTIASWVAANDCQPDAKVEPLPDPSDDGTKVKRTSHAGGRGGAEVVLFTIDHGGHTWPGRPPRLPMLGTSTNDIAANDLMWEFFASHPKP